MISSVTLLEPVLSPETTGSLDDDTQMGMEFVPL